MALLGCGPNVINELNIWLAEQVLGVNSSVIRVGVGPRLEDHHDLFQ